MPDQPTPAPWTVEDVVIARARDATHILRDFARTHGMHHRERDPLVMAIHNALDAYHALLADARAAKE